MKKWLIFLLIVMVAGLTFAEKLGVLTEVLTPEMIEVSENEEEEEWEVHVTPIK